MPSSAASKPLPSDTAPVVAFEGPVQGSDREGARSSFDSDDGVVFIGVAQEQVSGLRFYQKQPRRRRRRGTRTGHPPCFAAYRGKIDVNQHYFYIRDRDFGLCFIKISSYLPFNIKVWLNGHEWAKKQLDHRGIDYTALDNGFLTCDEPQALQQICNAFGPEHVERFFRRWLAKLPHPFSAEDRRAGFRYQLSILQLEASLTQVFDRPLHGRHFFEEVIRDNLDLGRPDRVQLLFERRISRRTPGRFRTRVLTAGVQPSLRFDYKRTRVKQYFKLERALRWGDPRVMALLSGLCAFMAAPEGLTNRTLRPRVSMLFDAGPRGYSPSRMSYDLRRLRLNGIIKRVPKSHRYVLTPTGRRIAFFFTKSFTRIVRPVLHRTDPGAPHNTSDRLRRAWQACERELNSAISSARIAA